MLKATKTRKIVPRPKIVMPSPAEDRQIIAAAEADPNAQQLTPKQMKAMVSIQVVRGHPISDVKKQLDSVRYSPEVLAYFRPTGDGWQS